MDKASFGTIMKIVNEHSKTTNVGLRLGAVIDKVGSFLPEYADAKVFAFRGPVDAIASYRGYYDHLAISYNEELDSDDEHSLTAQQLYDQLQEAASEKKSFYGYKGGDFYYNRDTPVWIARWGQTENFVVADVIARHYPSALTKKLQCATIQAPEVDGQHSGDRFLGFVLIHIPSIMTW